MIMADVVPRKGGMLLAVYLLVKGDLCTQSAGCTEFILANQGYLKC
jgi:hypothetical protein